MKALTCFLTAALFAASAAAQPAAPVASPAAPVASPATPAAPEIAPPAVPVAPPGARLDDAIRLAYETLPPCMVSVRIKVLEEREASYEERSPIEAVYDEVVRERLPVLLSGVRVSAEGLVLIRDPNLPLKRYEEISATDADGVVTPMRVAGVLEHYAAVLLEPVTPPAQKLPCLTFEKTDLQTGDRFLLAEPAFIEDALVFEMDESFALSVAVESEEKHLQLVWWQEPTYNEAYSNAAPATAPIVFDGRGRPIGIALDNSLWTSDDGADSWIGTRIMADDRRTPDGLSAASQKIITAARSSVKEIEIRFRSDSRVSDSIRLEEGRLMAYGLLLDKAGTIFVPTDLDRIAVRKIDKITLIEGAQRIETQFLGLFRDFGGFLIKAKTVTGEPAALVEEGPLPRGKIFYSLSVRRRYGRRSDEVEYNRYLDVAKSYRESRYPVPRKPLRVGDFLADEDGRLLGFCAPFRRQDRDEILARQRSSQGQARQTRPYLFSEVAAVLRAPQGHFDPFARPMSRKEELRPAWLGVEFQPMTPALARALDAETATRGGARGLLVTDVYDASPATRNGIKPGDILLSISLQGFAEEIDLAAPAGGEGRRFDGQGRPWRPTVNYLTTLLTQIGPGREARLRLLQGRKENTLGFTVEKAPDDFDNADQFQETSIGLTVRELTYEVRKVLRLPADAPGVVVSQVQSGSKAAVAQISALRDHLQRQRPAGHDAQRVRAARPFRPGDRKDRVPGGRPRRDAHRRTQHSRRRAVTMKAAFNTGYTENTEKHRGIFPGFQNPDFFSVFLRVLRVSVLKQEAHAGRTQKSSPFLRALPAPVPREPPGRRTRPLRDRRGAGDLLRRPAFRRGAAACRHGRLRDDLLHRLQPRLRLLPELRDQPTPRRAADQRGRPRRDHAGPAAQRLPQHQLGHADAPGPGDFRGAQNRPRSRPAPPHRLQLRRLRAPGNPATARGPGGYLHARREIPLGGNLRPIHHRARLPASDEVRPVRDAPAGRRS